LSPFIITTEECEPSSIQNNELSLQEVVDDRKDVTLLLPSLLILMIDEQKISVQNMAETNENLQNISEYFTDRIKNGQKLLTHQDVQQIWNEEINNDTELCPILLKNNIIA